MKLITACGQSLFIIDAGQYNAHQGPDFTNARIRVGNVEWAGNIELHLRTSDWVRHAHQLDENYKNIILHVVWINDVTDYAFSPIVELSKFVAEEQLYQEDNYLSTYHLHCQLKEFTPVEIIAHYDLYRLGMERLLLRKEQILQLFDLHRLDYSRVLWRLIFRCFGRSTNADAFESLFLSIPIHVFRLYAFDLRLIEALMMGQSSLLHDQIRDDYPQLLLKQYIMLKHRHELHPIAEKMKFLRMRPRNFPTVRLAQLAAFFQQNISLVKQLLAIEDLKGMDHLFDVLPHPYWQNHFLFDRMSVDQCKEIGQTVRQQTIVNAFIPFLMAYSEINKAPIFEEKALRWLHELRPEQDALIQMFSDLGFKARSILDTQSLHELYHRYCKHDKCASCVRGKMLQRV